MVEDRVRTVRVEVAEGLAVTILERPDAEAVLEAAVANPAEDPYASILWPAAVAVARELVGRIMPGDGVVDVGAGTGLVALTAARLGARVVALDHDPAALRRIERSAAVQGLAVETRAFDICAPVPLPDAEIVVLADVLYERALARSVARRAAEASARGARVVVGDPGRFGRSEFVRELGRLGIDASFREVRIRLPGERVDSTVGILWIDPARQAAGG